MTNRPHHDRCIARRRRGVALADVMIGGVMLAIGLGVIISVTTRALAAQSEGQQQIIASWLIDETLNMVIVEGPAEYSRVHDLRGEFEPPFQDFSYDIVIDEAGGLGEAYRVGMTVFWPAGRDQREVYCETVIASRLGEPLQLREPLMPLDREGRWLGEEQEPVDGGDEGDAATGGADAAGGGGSTGGGR